MKHHETISKSSSQPRLLRLDGAFQALVGIRELGPSGIRRVVEGLAQTYRRDRGYDAKSFWWCLLGYVGYKQVNRSIWIYGGHIPTGNMT